MRATLSLAILFASFALARGGPSGKDDSAAKNPSFSLPPADSQTTTPRFSAKQIAPVQTWIREKAPECPAAITEAVAQQFLEEVQQRSPEKLDQLAAGNFSGRDLESTLLRLVGAKLAGAEHVSAREEIARRRLALLSTAASTEAGTTAVDPKVAFEKIKEGSQTQYRRLLEGKMDDDDLQLLFKKVTQGDAPKKTADADKPKVLSAADIVGEFSHRNQSGSSLQRLQAYVVEGRLKTSSGEQQDLLLFRMRPDSFRLVIKSGGSTRHVLAARAGHYWQQPRGGAPAAFAMQATDQRRYLAEFADPLFVGDDFTFERLEDGAHEGKKYFRIGVRRADGSGYVAQIDVENFREIGRENVDHSVARYSDFREIGGVVYAFKEELSDKAGNTSVLEIVRITPNPGLIQDLFELPAKNGVSYFDLESFTAPSSVAAVKF